MRVTDVGVSVLTGKFFRANLALSLAALFWGTTFIFQRQAMEHITPLPYSGLRFTLGALCLLPLTLPRAFRQLKRADNPAGLARQWLSGSLLAGGLLFAGVTFQQYGLIWTTAGKAGFITCLYVVLVPLILRLAGHKILLGEGLGAVLAVTGLYLLSFTAGSFSLSRGDDLVLVGAFIWAAHVLALGGLAPKMDTVILATGQALVCGLMGLAAATALGQWPTWEALRSTWLDIVWGGFISVTLGFTLQVIGQKDAKPASAAIILQMESVVAAVAGWLILNEIMTGRMIWGAVLMLAGILTSQLWPIWVTARRLDHPAGETGSQGRL